MKNEWIKRVVSLMLGIVMMILAACQTAHTSDPVITTHMPSGSDAGSTSPTTEEVTGAESTWFETESIAGEFDLFEGYRVIIADNASNDIKDMADDFVKAFQKATSIELTIKSDWEGGPIKRTEKEIVLGDTTRRDEFAVSESLGDQAFQLARKGDKIFCVGKNEEATLVAVKYLITVYLIADNPNRNAICEDGKRFGLSDGAVMDGDAFSRYGTTKTELEAYIAAHDTLDVTACKVDSTGVVDATELLQYLHNSGKKIYYPNGFYLFNGETLCFDGGVEFESQAGVIIHNSISKNPIVNFDAFGNLVGLQQNHLEYKTGQLDSKHGSLVSPPLSTMTQDTDVDFMPIFYNDFGLARSLTGQYGWSGWFYWSWNHQDNLETLDSPGYDPQRHPLLGWYYGDDPVVLDWICYWLRQYGINQMILLSTPLRDTWEDPYDAGHWHYQLFNHVKNFDAMEYVLEVTFGGNSRDETLNHWKEVIRYYRDYPHYYTQVVDGKTLAVVYNWQENVLCSRLGGAEKYAAFMQEVSDYAKELLGVDGILVMSRASVGFTEAQEMTMHQGGVYHYAAGYEPNCIENQGSLKTYQQYVENFNGDLASDKNVLAISTGMYSHSHPSGWTIRGNTPDLFEEWASKTVKYLRDTKRLLPIVTIYNISEWAEGGPGLQPNMQDGFGYLEAIANALDVTPGT